MQTNTTLIFHIYLFAVFLTMVAFAILKCKYNIHTFDKFLYIAHTDDTSAIEWLKYILMHFVTYFVFGFLFTLDNLYGMLLKTIVIEIALVQIKECSFEQMGDVKSALTSVLIGMIGYYIGGYFRTIV